MNSLDTTLAGCLSAYRSHRGIPLEVLSCHLAPYWRDTIASSMQCLRRIESGDITNLVEDHLGSRIVDYAAALGVTPRERQIILYALRTHTSIHDSAVQRYIPGKEY